MEQIVKPLMNHKTKINTLLTRSNQVKIPEIPIHKLSRNELKEYMNSIEAHERESAIQDFKEMLLNEDGDPNEILRNHREEIKQEILCCLFKEVNLVYLFAKPKGGEVHFIFEIRYLLSNDNDIQHLRRYYQLIQLYECCSNNPIYQGLIILHPLYIRLKKLFELVMNKKELFHTPVIFWRYTLLLTLSHEQSLRNTQAILDTLNQELSKNQDPYKLIQLINQQLQSDLNQAIQDHIYRLRYYSQTYSREWFRNIKSNLVILCSITQYKIFTSRDHALIISIRKFNQSFFKKIKKLQKQSKKEEHVVEQTKPKEVKITIPFLMLRKINYNHFSRLQDDLKNNQLAKPTFLQLKNLFSEQKLQKPIIWTGSCKDLKTFIITLKEKHIIHTEAKGYWEKICSNFKYVDESTPTTKNKSYFFTPTQINGCKSPTRERKKLFENICDQILEESETIK
ncbi:hypothetical protein K5X82_07750 [Halosquirtibacter xylanolyticus]|uniref:hypothetical protein n=1 Tax=Halosquirtibacter xylanolyticus TaxID=3374599 RepID=UPI003748657D|nr:hypothetical protein K5X82_07750 [Prolixibacteraceae bacterium]